MFSLELESPQPTRDMLIAELFEAGCSGINELSDWSIRAFFDDEQSAQASATRFGGTPEPADDRDWVTEAQRSLEPQNVGDLFFLVPEWRDDPTPAGRFRIEVNNGLAFGTGKHETTRLCLELLERQVKGGMTVLDIGTGTGILSQAAKLLGAAHVYACDIDHGACEIAREHGVDAFTGSAEAIRSDVADLLVANISPEAITAMRDEIPRLLKSGGVAILSGLELHDEVPFKAAELHTEGNWKALVVMRRQAKIEGTMKVLVIGATGGTGRAIVTQSLEAGHSVTALVREEPQSDSFPAGVRVVVGDVLDTAVLHRALADQDAVADSLGSSMSGPFKTVHLFSDSTKLLIDVMKAENVKRLVCITGIGAGDSEGHGGFVYDHLVQPLVLRGVYEDKDRQEKLIEASGLDWTIVRPANLSDGEAMGGTRAITDLTGFHGGSIRRADVAAFVVAQLSSGEWLRKHPVLYHEAKP